MTDTDEALYRAVQRPTLEAIQALGGSGSIQEIDAKAIELGSFSDAVQAEMMPDGRRTRLSYYMAWSRTRLRRIGLADNSRQGIWSLTDRGRAVGPADYAALWEEMRAAYRTSRKPNDDDVDEGEAEWKDELIDVLTGLAPGQFEDVCKQLLREAGFTKVEVTGRSGDGGIDGVGVAKVGLLSFPTFFQCKKYREGNAVAAGAVRDFRGAMAGRGDKGLLITTSTFTPAARSEATRDGAPPVDLVDGDQLCELLKDTGVGVRVDQRTVEDVRVDRTWWSERFPVGSAPHP